MHRAAALGAACQRARRAQQAQQRRQYREIGKQRHTHAETGDHAELGQPQITGRHEGEEADRGTDRREGQRATGALGSGAERAALVRPVRQLFAVTHRKLDTEVDTHADEQHRETD